MNNRFEPLKSISTRREFLLVAGTGVLSATALNAFAKDSSRDGTSAVQGENLPAGDSSKRRAAAVVWKNDVEGGEVEVTYAALHALDRPAKENGAADSPGDFSLVPGVKRLEIRIDDAHTESGARATRVTVRFRKRNAGSELPAAGFTFFLRDIAPNTPILVRGLQVAVLAADDRRTYEQVDAAVRAKKLQSERELIDAAPEETYEGACRGTKEMRCPTWLGLGRDMRIFRVMPLDSVGYWGYVEPYDLVRSAIPAEGRDPGRYYFILGRGARCSVDIVRRLEDGVLPIVKSTQRDGDIEYSLTLFATLEKEPLTADNVRGTHWLAAYANSSGKMLTKNETAQYDQMLPAEVTQREQELICRVRVEAVNRGSVPRYAYAKAGYIKANALEGVGTAKFIEGRRTNAEGKVMAVNLLNGEPMPQEEMAILIQPGEKETFDFIFPHRPLTHERAAAAGKQSYEAHYGACKAFWRNKLAQGARISLPDAVIEERLRAGLLHLDIATLGLSESGPLAAFVGWYAPIGSESAPIIQFYDSLGYHRWAERCIQLFLDRQRDDGFIQTCLGYQLETGPVLWTIGEHFRYTRDVAWARRIEPNVLKACRYLLDWRRRNMKEELRGKGYGLLEGKVADPQDFYHSFMLNALTYLGLKRVVEMYAGIDPDAVAEVQRELAPYLADIRKSYAENVARSPVIPLGNGTWIPSFSPWAEYAGPVSLYADGGSWLSHYMFASRDSLIGALYLGIGEVLDPNEQLSEWLLYAHQELMTHRNAGFSQPYYCRHDWLHLRRGEVKQYLKTYYNQFASLQDRETYTFWEHYVGVGESQHKTHEEAWFLMQTRWMLWEEDYDSGTLRLLSMIPRAWLEAGKEIVLEKCKSYFGEFDLRVRSIAPDGRVEAAVRLHGPAKNWPKTVVFRLPHPAGLQPSEVRGGQFDVRTESVILTPAKESMSVVLRY
ncbi:MAG: hypothetical protein IT426_04580 [Pirellulales bacterium]|nr:hypothetical protein [Pirellulales bacterium]